MGGNSGGFEKDRLSIVKVDHDFLLGLRRRGSIFPVLHRLDRVLGEDGISAQHFDIRHGPVRKHGRGQTDQPSKVQILEDLGILCLDL